MKLQNPFLPDADEIEALGYAAQAKLVNGLIANRGFRLGVDPSQIRTTLRLNDADGGIDALTDIGALHDAFLATGEIVWQYKSDRFSQAKLKKELSKSGVQEAFKNGAGYILVLGRGMAVGGQHGQTARQKTLEDLAKGAGCRGPVYLLTANSISIWISEDPAALFAVRPEIRGFVSVDQALRTPRHSIPYELDEQRDELAVSIVEWLNDRNPSRTSIRIQGVAGVGKTRLALESVRRAGLEGAVLYSANVPESTDLFDWVASNEAVQAIVIIDECEEVQAQSLLEPRVEHCGGRLRMITIGPGVVRTDVYSLGVLDQSAMERVVKTAAGGLPDNQVRWVVEKSQGFVKLASVVAQAIARRGIRDISDMPSNSEISGIVQRMLIRSEEGQRALQGIALLRRVGFKDGVEVEGQAIAAFIGINWNAMQGLLQPAIDQGIVSIRGRYWYVSPELLGLWLAADFWRSQSHRIQAFIDSLPSQEAVVAFTSRFGSLGEIPAAEEVIEQALSAQGPFPTIEALNSARSSSLFWALARTAPAMAAEAADRLTHEASDEQLRAFEAGRREFIWALEHLLGRRISFPAAIRSLRRLAENENEAITNNATGVWVDTFLTVLAETEVPYLERMDILEEALDSERPESRRLGVKGLESALEGNESKILQGTHSGIPREPWRPQSYGQLRELKRRPVSLLKKVVNDSYEDIRSAARAVLCDSLRHLAELGLTNEWVEVADLIQGESDEERRSLWSAIQLTLEFEKAYLSETQRDLLLALSRRFFGDSFSERLRRFLGPGMPANIVLSEDAWNAALQELAREAFQTRDALTDEFNWLVSGEAEQLWPFALELGRADSDHVLFEAILHAARDARDPRLLSGYLIGRAETDGDSEAQWREAVLDDLARNEPTGRVAWNGTYLGPASVQGLRRILQLAEKGWIGNQELAVLRYGDWPYLPSTNELIDLFQFLISAGTSDTMTAALSIVDKRLPVGSSETESDSAFLQVAWELLEHPAGWSHEPMLVWTWKHIGEKLLESEPARLANIIINMETEGSPAFHDERLNLLSQAAQREPERVWEMIGDALLGSESSHDLAWELRSSRLLEKFPSKVVEDWLGGKDCEAAKIVAQAVQIESPPLPEVARILLRQCGEETERVLARTFLSGVWTGFAEPYWSQKLEFAKELAHDSELAVSRWASELIEPLRTQVRMAQRDDAERGWA